MKNLSFDNRDQTLRRLPIQDTLLLFKLRLPLLESRFLRERRQRSPTIEIGVSGDVGVLSGGDDVGAVLLRLWKRELFDLGLFGVFGLLPALERLARRYIVAF